MNGFIEVFLKMQVILLMGIVVCLETGAALMFIYLVMNWLRSFI